MPGGPCGRGRPQQPPTWISKNSSCRCRVLSLLYRSSPSLLVAGASICMLSGALWGMATATAAMAGCVGHWPCSSGSWRARQGQQLKVPEKTAPGIGERRQTRGVATCTIGQSWW